MSRVLAVPGLPRIADVGGAVIGVGISVTTRQSLGSAPTPTPTPAPTPTVAISSAVAQNEGNSGTTAYVYTVTRSSSVGEVSVPWTFSPGTSSADDFVGGAYPVGGTVAIADGALTGTITVNVAGDATVEPDESFTVSIAAPAGYALGSPSSATGTILNDDAAGPDNVLLADNGDFLTADNGDYLEAA